LDLPTLSLDFLTDVSIFISLESSPLRLALACASPAVISITLTPLLNTYAVCTPATHKGLSGWVVWESEVGLSLSAGVVPLGLPLGDGKLFCRRLLEITRVWLSMVGKERRCVCKHLT
jgi:hypothetical protein